jgi:hypothetical protein
LGPIPNPQSPIPNPQSPIFSGKTSLYLNIIFELIINLKLLIFLFKNEKVYKERKKYSYYNSSTYNKKNTI